MKLKIFKGIFQKILYCLLRGKIIMKIFQIKSIVLSPCPSSHILHSPTTFYEAGAVEKL